jgi:hypothetical protein
MIDHVKSNLVVLQFYFGIQIWMKNDPQIATHLPSFFLQNPCDMAISIWDIKLLQTNYT